MAAIEREDFTPDEIAAALDTWWKARPDEALFDLQGMTLEEIGDALKAWLREHVERR